LQFKLAVFFSKLGLVVSLGECLIDTVSRSEGEQG